MYEQDAVTVSGFKFWSPLRCRHLHMHMSWEQLCIKVTPGFRLTYDFCLSPTKFMLIKKPLCFSCDVVLQLIYKTYLLTLHDNFKDAFSSVVDIIVRQVCDSVLSHFQFIVRPRSARLPQTGTTAVVRHPRVVPMNTAVSPGPVSIPFLNTGAVLELWWLYV